MGANGYSFGGEKIKHDLYLPTFTKIYPKWNKVLIMNEYNNKTSRRKYENIHIIGTIYDSLGRRQKARTIKVNINKMVLIKVKNLLFKRQC